MSTPVRNLRCACLANPFALTSSRSPERAAPPNISCNKDDIVYFPVSLFRLDCFACGFEDRIAGRNVHDHSKSASELAVHWSRMHRRARLRTIQLYYLMPLGPSGNGDTLGINQAREIVGTDSSPQAFSLLQYRNARARVGRLDDTSKSSPDPQDQRVIDFRKSFDFETLLPCWIIRRQEKGEKYKSC
jgi:hypothetical protein